MQERLVCAVSDDGEMKHENEGHISTVHEEITKLTFRALALYQSE